MNNNELKEDIERIVNLEICKHSFDVEGICELCGIGSDEYIGKTQQILKLINDRDEKIKENIFSAIYDYRMSRSMGFSRDNLLQVENFNKKLDCITKDIDKIFSGGGE